MIAATGIEAGFAGWALVVAAYVLRGGELVAADSAEDCLLVPFVAWPYLDRVICEIVVAVFAGVVGIATLHLDRDDIYRLVVVSTTSLSIKIDPVHRWPRI